MTGAGEDGRAGEVRLLRDDCRHAARGARAADRGRASLHALRPRGITWVLRSRPPAWLLLYTAARDGRLVWRGPGQFVILARPARERGGARRPAVRFLEFADRRWDFLTLLGPGGAALLTATALALYGRLGVYGATFALGGALVLVLICTLYVLVLMCAVALAGGIWVLRALEGWRGGDEKSEALSSLCADNWSVELWHGPADAAMVGSVIGRASALSPDGTAPAVLCEASRVTSLPACQEIRRAPRVESRRIGKDEVFVLGGGELRLEDRQNAGMAGGISALILGIGVTFTVQATLIAEAERAACPGRCPGRPVEFGQALVWLVDVFFWGVVPSGFEAATLRARVFAHLGQLLLLTVIGCAAVAGRQARRRLIGVAGEVREDLAAVLRTAPTTVVVLTAVNTEAKAVRRRLADLEEPRREHGTIFEVGMVPGTSSRVALAVMGHGNPPAAALAERAIRAFAPSALLMVGVADALADGIAPGDVVVADRVYGYHSGREGPDGFHARPRAIEMSHELLQLAGYLDRTDGWVGELPSRSPGGTPGVHIGPVAAGEQRLDSTRSATSRHLRTHYEDAIAIERESFGGAYAAHLNASLSVLIIRGISGRADGTRTAGATRDRRRTAADNAAAFAISVIRNMRAGKDEATT